MEAIQPLRIKTPGATLAARQYAGNGEPIVLLHGGPGMGDYFGSFPELLSPPCRGGRTSFGKPMPYWLSAFRTPGTCGSRMRVISHGWKTATRSRTRCSPSTEPTSKQHHTWPDRGRRRLQLHGAPAQGDDEIERLLFQRHD